MPVSGDPGGPKKSVYGPKRSRTRRPPDADNFGRLRRAWARVSDDEDLRIVQKTVPKFLSPHALPCRCNLHFGISADVLGPVLN